MVKGDLNLKLKFIVRDNENVYNFYGDKWTWEKTENS